jgi:hypothetical protein
VSNDEYACAGPAGSLLRRTGGQQVYGTISGSLHDTPAAGIAARTESSRLGGPQYRVQKLSMQSSS